MPKSINLSVTQMTRTTAYDGCFYFMLQTKDFRMFKDYSTIKLKNPKTGKSKIFNLSLIGPSAIDFDCKDDMVIRIHDVPVDHDDSYYI
jgi:hypothetical protein